MLQADIHILHQSDFYQLADYKCHCDICSVSQPEYNDGFCISFIRKGFFEYRVFRGIHEVHIGRILLSKPGYEHTARHIDNQPDVTTVFEFTGSFFEMLKEQYESVAGWFLKNNDLHSILLSCSVEADYLHHRILQCIQSKQASSLQIDEMVIELLNKILDTLGNKQELPALPRNIRQFHLNTAENSAAYIREHFSENISLQQLSQHCFISPFHFSRIFKTIFGISPHQYLLNMRLQHARILLITTNAPVSDIASGSGFNSLEHFATAFKKYYGLSPSEYRKQLV